MCTAYISKAPMPRNHRRIKGKGPTFIRLLPCSPSMLSRSYGSFLLLFLPSVSLAKFASLSWRENGGGSKIGLHVYSRPPLPSGIGRSYRGCPGREKQERWVRPTSILEVAATHLWVGGWETQMSCASQWRNGAITTTVLLLQMSAMPRINPTLGNDDLQRRSPKSFNARQAGPKYP